MTASGVALTAEGSALQRGWRPMHRARGTRGPAALGQLSAALLLAAGLLAGASGAAGDRAVGGAGRGVGGLRLVHRAGHPGPAGGSLERPRHPRAGRAAPANPASAATAPRQIQARCGDRYRPPETAEDAQVAAAGWTLLGGATAGWDVRVVRGVTDVDEQLPAGDLPGPRLRRRAVRRHRLALPHDPGGGRRPVGQGPGLAQPPGDRVRPVLPGDPPLLPGGRRGARPPAAAPRGAGGRGSRRAESLPAPPEPAYAGDPGAVTADGGGAWLNAVPGGWNQIGAPVPPAPPAQPWPDACGGLLRAPQTDADAQVAAPGGPSWGATRAAGGSPWCTA